MGVPALFRWLSKKYPKIIESVIEDEPRKVPRPNGEEEEVPIDMSKPNPNGIEFDCLYLDMNGIVHPCTHPEGKPAPSTEEEMMVEVFKYTERVVNMVRPRKLLMMAIDGVAPRAKMNQQRSRRFRSAQEAKEKQIAKEEALAEWKAMGLPVSDEAASNEPAWDSNAITPGTPFMDLLAQSLRYWVVKKMSEDPGWKNLQVLISDASVPGEGEHKIMDHIRRQRSHPSHDPNTKHVIYGLDADLIMLSLATHEPYFKVLREDVFQQDKKGCHICGQQGHFAAQCRGEAKEKRGKDDAGGQAGEEKKPFIFLDVATLREYLEIELNVPNCPFGFNLERAIDDWVFLIFFVGNDFLPHLPSLEIRDGAIDTLLRLWKQRLPSMSDYLTKHGTVNLDSAQVILEGLAAEEDEIFRRRRAAEERQEEKNRRRKAEDEARKRPRYSNGNDGFKHGDLDYVQGRPPPINSPAKGADQPKNDANHSTAVKALGSGSVDEIIKNQAAIRKANLSAAETLKAELAAGLGPITLKRKEVKKIPVPGKADKEQNGVDTKPDKTKESHDTEAPVADDQVQAKAENPAITESVEAEPEVFKMDEELDKQEGDQPSPGRKRTLDEADLDADAENADEDDADNAGDDDDEDTQEKKDPIVSTLAKRKVNPDGTVDVEDTVKLWEPGYRERYYREKFGVELSDTEFRRKVAKAYVEGLSWVLAYYYQGVPSWQWYYPYHYSPFAADFTDIQSFDIKFDLGQPFKPFEQLMGVLPAASRKSIPESFHPLMVAEDSAIIDFYPENFEIDMNGKKMAWQGVALLPFIDETRLLDALKDYYPKLTGEEKRRNTFGRNTLYVGEGSSLYEQLCTLYERKKDDSESERTTIDPSLSGGITGEVSAEPGFIPGTKFESPVSSQPGQDDVLDNRSMAAVYYFPEQKTPHRSVLLKGVKPPPRKLDEGDREWTRRGGPDGGTAGTPVAEEEAEVGTDRMAKARATMEGIKDQAGVGRLRMGFMARAMAAAVVGMMTVVAEAPTRTQGTLVEANRMARTKILTAAEVVAALEVGMLATVAHLLQAIAAAAAVLGLEPGHLALLKTRADMAAAAVVVDTRTAARTRTWAMVKQRLEAEGIMDAIRTAAARKAGTVAMEAEGPPGEDMQGTAVEEDEQMGMVEWEGIRRPVLLPAVVVVPTLTARMGITSLVMAVVGTTSLVQEEEGEEDTGVGVVVGGGTEPSLRRCSHALC